MTKSTHFKLDRNGSCEVADCGRPILARRLCRMHYQRKAKHGTPHHHVPRGNERFWRFVSKTDGCWLWTGTVAGSYGQFSLGGYSRTPAHRHSYEINVGTIPDGMFVCHRCDNPLCVRPDHLFIGTASDNMRDMVAKGRHGKARASFRAKLCEADVRVIRASQETTASLAERFGVDHSTVYQVRTRRTWRNVA